MAKLKAVRIQEAKSQERREAAIAELYDVYKLRPDDTVRFPKRPGPSDKVEGRPLSVNKDGSVDCWADGQIRSIRAERIEVKMRGPRGGIVWEPLVPPTEGN